MDFPASKLRDGYGIFVVNLLNSLADSALSSRQHKWRLPSYPPEEDDIEGKLNDIKKQIALGHILSIFFNENLYRESKNRLMPLVFRLYLIWRPFKVEKLMPPYDFLGNHSVEIFGKNFDKMSPSAICFFYQIN